MNDSRHTRAWIRSSISPVGFGSRGGLWLVSNQTYTLFFLMEEIIQSKWTKANLDTQAEAAKQSLIDALIENEDVHFQWCFCCGGLDTEMILLKKIINNKRVCTCQCRFRTIQMSLPEDIAEEKSKLMKINEKSESFFNNMQCLDNSVSIVQSYMDVFEGQMYHITSS